MKRYIDIQNNRFFNDYLSNYRLNIAIIAITMFWALIYILFVHNTVYESTAKLWIKDIKSNSFITKFTDFNSLEPLSRSTNPVLNQKEVLKSKKLSNAVKKEYLSLYPGTKKDSLNGISSYINVRAKAGTDILNVSFKWKTPESSKKILEIILEEYKDINLEINNKLKRERRKYLDLKIKEIKQNLQEVREEIEKFKTKNLANDISVESKALIRQNIGFSTKLENIKAKIKSTKSSLNELENKLSLKLDDAIKAVALGSENSQLNRLRDDLNKSLQKYHHDSTRLAETNPKIVALKNQINTIKEQIENQITLTLGKYSKKPEISVFDPVREDIIKKFAQMQSDYIGLLAEKQSLEESLKNNERQQAKIPQKKLVLDNLHQEENNLSNAFDELRKKQMEAKIQEAESISNFSIIDEPTLPGSPAFPNKLHTLLLAFLAGGILSIFASISKTLVEDVCNDLSFIEKITRADILGVIPWFKREEESSLYDEDEKNILDIAYKNIISNLLVNCCKGDIKILSFASTSIKIPESHMIYDLAKAYRSLGHRTIILDTNFQSPSYKHFQKNIKINFSELILETEKKIKSKTQINKETFLRSITYDENDIAFLGNTEPVTESYKYFGTLAYSQILSFLREEFDWVLIDLPPAQIFSESFIISKQSDGLIILADKFASFSEIHSMVKNIRKFEIPIIGTIVRQENTRIEREYERYLQYKYKDRDTLDIDNLEDDDLNEIEDIINGGKS
ncbi:hypothetical protein GF378_00405 [Candidatus Pacearchaeota archaeon]|nr:hypothetical protein [Candidatus Pacearchaeota archaeon]